MPLRVITLAMAPGPGFPEGSPDHRYVLSLARDAEGRPAALAWAADPAPWPARRIRPDAPDAEGDVQHDPEGGWHLRLFGDAAESADAPRIGLVLQEGALRPGGYVTLDEPGAEARSFRVVGVVPE